MNELDYAVMALLLISVTVGGVRGAIREVLNIVGWILAFVLSHAYAIDLAPLFSDWVGEPIARLVLAWVLIFAVVLVVVALLATMLSEAVKKLGLGTLDRLVGAAIGLMRGLLVVVALALLAGLTKVPQGPMWRAAASTPWIEIVASYAKGALPDSIAARIRYRAPANMNSPPAAPPATRPTTSA